MPEKLENLDIGSEDKNCSKFFEPLVHARIPLSDDVMISKSLWCDKFVKVNEILVGKRNEPFVDDGFCHRLYCISTRGWECFRHLFNFFDSSITIANEILTKNLFLMDNSKRENPDFIRKIIYDTSPSFCEYSEELVLARSKLSYLDLLDNKVRNKWKWLMPLQKESDNKSSTSVKGPLKRHLSQTETENQRKGSKKVSENISEMFSSEDESMQKIIEQNGPFGTK